MSVQLLKERKKMRKMEKRRNFVIGVVLILMSILFMDFALTAWSEEIEIQGQNNKNWQEKYSK